MVPLDHGLELWSSPLWLDRAASWLDERLATSGIERIGPIEQPHIQPWATVLRAPTTAGPVWLKAAGPGTAFEVRLYEFLDEVAPDRVLTPIATDTNRGWIVLPDGGPSLGEFVRDAELVEALAAILPQYGYLQRDLAPHVDQLVAMGVTDMRPEVMPQRFAEALAVVRYYTRRQGAASDHETYRRVEALRTAFADWCDRLAGLPAAPSLDHNDLHAWNIFVGGGACGAHFYDWGDSVVAHPFASMLITLGFVAGRLRAGPDDSRVIRVRDAYLEAFTDLAPRAELVEALELACRVGKVARALVWDRALGADPTDAPAHRSAPLQSMGSLLDESYLGVV